MPHSHLPTIALILLALTLPLHAQSGRASFTGYVAFDGIAYVDTQPTATIELFRPDDKTKEHPLASATTNEHGHYTLQPSALGEVLLRISAPGFDPYEIPIYLPSDFTGNLATLLKPTKPTPKSTTKPAATTAR